MKAPVGASSSVHPPLIRLGAARQSTFSHKGRRHVLASPRPVAGLAIDGVGRRAVARSLGLMLARSRDHPSGDFCSRPFRFRGIVQRIRAVLPEGEPLDGTSPRGRLRWPIAGGAGLSPRNHRRDRRSRRRGGMKCS